ncbi:MAG: protein-methionine-sulfoxide reductase catalytic subunit MsrP [Cyclobacteriaceae bacterium]
MANIIFPKPWDGKQLKATDETDYINRRKLLKQLGLTTGALMAAPMIGFGNSRRQDNSFKFAGQDDFYPAKRNEKYTVDRPMTDEYDATHHNNFYEFIHPKDDNIYNVYKYVDDFDNRDWRFEVSGLANKTGVYFLEEMIKEFGLEERVYRFRCVERWSMAVPWTGFPLKKMIDFFGPMNNANYIKMTTYADANEMVGVKNQNWYPWPYTEGLRMDEAMNELAFIATGLYGKPIPKQNGAPMRLVVPWKYGYKNTKSIVKFEFMEKEPKTFWNVLNPNEYPFISNVDPEVPHPRWSQKIERMIPDGEPRPTLKYNGYGEYVAGMYKG